MTTVEEFFNRIDNTVIVDENGKEKPIGLNQEQEDVIKYLIRGFFIELLEELRLEKQKNTKNDTGASMMDNYGWNCAVKELNNKIDKLLKGE